MPGNQIAPPFAIMSQFDARPWAGLPLYTRPPDTISMPAFSGVGDGLFTDLLTFLNGRASVPGRVLDEDILATWTLSGGFPSVVNAYINADDRLVLESDLDFAVTAA